MIDTPREHLPPNWPLPYHEDSLRFEPLWKRAFEIHRVLHNFNPKSPFREAILNTDPSEENYCDCYERAYLEFYAKYLEAKKAMERFAPVFEKPATTVFSTVPKRKIIIPDAVRQL